MESSKTQLSLARRTFEFVLAVFTFLVDVFYFIFKGRDPSYNHDPAVCVVNTPTLQPLSESTNVCCVHGVQTRKLQAEKTAASGTSTLATSHTQQLKRRFETLAQNEANGGQSVKNLFGKTEAPQQPKESLLSRLFNYFPSFSPTSEKSVKLPRANETVYEKPQVPATENLITTARLPAPPPPPAAPFQELSDTTVEKFKPVQGPQYPLAYVKNRAHLNELREKLNERSINDSLHSKLIPNQFTLTQTQPNLQSNVEKTHTVYTRSAVKSKQGERQVEDEEEEQEQQVQEGPALKSGTCLHFAKSHVYYQSPQKATVTVRTVYEDARNKNVQVTRKESSGSNPVSASKTSPITIQVPVDGSVKMQKSKYNDQLVQQVRACQSIANELKFGTAPTSPSSKAQQMFSSRKNRMQNWVVSATRAEDDKNNLQASAEIECCRSSAEGDQFLLKRFYSPGGVHDITDMSKTYGDNLLTNIASPEKCHELSSMLSAPRESEKSVQLFQKRRQRSERFVVDDEKAVALPPPVARRAPAISAVIESVHEAAARRERSFRPIYANPTPSQSRFHLGAAVGKKTPVWAHERLFSPVPFAPAASRPFTPVDFGAKQRNTLPRGWRT